MDFGLVNPAVRIALDGLMMRQEAIANNVANLSTPNYTATNIEFEGAFLLARFDNNGCRLVVAARDALRLAIGGSVCFEHPEGGSADLGPG